MGLHLAKVPVATADLVPSAHRPGLHLLHLLPLELFIGNLHSRKRVVSNLLDLRDHVLHGVQHQGVGVAGEEQGSAAEHHADEDCFQDIVHCLVVDVGPLVEVEDEVECRVLFLRQQPGRELFCLRHAKLSGAIHVIGDEIGDLAVQQRKTSHAVAREGTVRVPRRGNDLKDFVRHGAIVVHVVLLSGHLVPFQDRFAPDLCGRDVLADGGLASFQADPEDLRVEPIRASRFSRTCGVCQEPVVVVDVLQNHLLVGLPRPLARHHLRERLEHIVGAILG
mmetsp:Transcript_108009/g.344842  ORF Transcript_108009/g.344842 Transcript_108009/m.344842 type:complete len:279 (+) Transcript_108009:453-1289(+)